MNILHLRGWSELEDLGFEPFDFYEENAARRHKGAFLKIAGEIVVTIYPKEGLGGYWIQTFFEGEQPCCLTVKARAVLITVREVISCPTRPINREGYKSYQPALTIGKRLVEAYKGMKIYNDYGIYTVQNLVQANDNPLVVALKGDHFDETQNNAEAARKLIDSLLN